MVLCMCMQARHALVWWCWNRRSMWICCCKRLGRDRWPSASRSFGLAIDEVGLNTCSENGMFDTVISQRLWILQSVVLVLDTMRSNSRNVHFGGTVTIF